MIEAEDLGTAGRVLGVLLSESERAQAVGAVSENAALCARLRARRLGSDVPPATVFAPWLLSCDDASGDRDANRRSGVAGRSGAASGVSAGVGERSADDVGFASIGELGRWLRDGSITSVALTEIYLDRLRRADCRLHTTVTFLDQAALDSAATADRELANGIDRGPLHGIPYGLKDIVDTAGVATTWGAAPYRDRVPEHDAYVTRALSDAGAVLIAKLSCGALAYGDIWFGAKTRNPWNPERGSSGSSAGSAAATAAGLVAFSIGSETYGSIVSPSMECGTVGLRPTVGTVPRTGVMALSTTFDKIGPITRTCDDALVVLAAISGDDSRDPESVLSTAERESRAAVLSRAAALAGERGLVIGYDERDLSDDGYHGLSDEVLTAFDRAGATLRPVSFPALDPEDLMCAMIVDAASHQQAVTLDHLDDELVWQDDRAWPNTFRAIRFLPAFDYVHAQRLRTLIVREVARVLEPLDAFIGPTFARGLVAATNLSGHPALVVPIGLSTEGLPQAISLCGRWFGEARLVAAGRVVEQAFGYRRLRPPAAW